LFSACHCRAIHIGRCQSHGVIAPLKCVCCSFGHLLTCYASSGSADHVNGISAKSVHHVASSPTSEASSNACSSSSSCCYRCGSSTSGSGYLINSRGYRSCTGPLEYGLGIRGTCSERAQTLGSARADVFTSSNLYERQSKRCICICTDHRTSDP
jgi:hypothetical protein